MKRLGKDKEWVRMLAEAEIRKSNNNIFNLKSRVPKKFP
tara:strand:- start:367 stop:483 length:117 start_codon:yes stop_codon:yes gene_type:complete